jgi:hypothetical protein
MKPISPLLTKGKLIFPSSRLAIAKAPLAQSLTPALLVELFGPMTPAGRARYDLWRIPELVPLQDVGQTPAPVTDDRRTILSSNRLFLGLMKSPRPSNLSQLLLMPSIFNYTSSPSLLELCHQPRDKSVRLLNGYKPTGRGSRV